MSEKGYIRSLILPFLQDNKPVASWMLSVKTQDWILGHTQKIYYLWHNKEDDNQHVCFSCLCP